MASEGGDEMSIGSRIKERREELGITQIQLAEQLGLTKGAIGNYETDQNSPKASTLYRVFDVLQCDANYLFQDELGGQNKKVLPEKDRTLLKSFHRLNDEGQEQLLDYADTLVKSEKFRKKSDAGELASEA